ncbi:MAG: glutamate--tRNA ligase family protein [Chitinophagia bacterium]
MPLSFQKTRIAPTPSGYLHLGNILSFVLTAGLARKTGASILLRIDDMDQERVRKEYLDDIFETLSFLNIPWDEGARSTEEHQQFFSQKLRQKNYQEALKKLESDNLLFACNCSRADLETTIGYHGTCLHKNMPLLANNVQWRLKTEHLGIQHRDLLKGDVTNELPTAMQYFQVRKKNGDPSYQVCSLMDDLHFGIDLIVRGEDLCDSTLAQVYLADALRATSFLKTSFIHHPLLKNDSHEKMSKSSGDTSVHSLRKNGSVPADIWAILAGKLNLKEKPQNWQEMYQLISQNWLNLA